MNHHISAGVNPTRMTGFGFTALNIVEKKKERVVRIEDLPVVITRQEYERLERRDKWLGYLEAAGVDNWEGIGEAILLRRQNEGGLGND
jgi:hypothetical protein